MSLTHDIAPRTLHDAVNALLDSVRLAPVMSLSAQDMNEDAAAALRTIETTSGEVQERGWEFNTSRNVTLPQSDTGEVPLPLNTRRVRLSPGVETGRLVQRGSRLYDPTRRTYIIGRAVTVDIVETLPFEELPAPARTYIVARAGSRYAPPRLPSSATFRFTDVYVQEALIALEHADAELANESLSETSPHFARMGRR